MSSFLALLAALSFALGSVLQQRGTLDTDAPEGDPHFLAEIVRKPVWLAGGACQALGWILQAVALGSGSLVVVQSLCSLSIVFALPLGARLTDQRVSRRSVVGAGLALVGIVVFVAIGQPQGGIAEPDAVAWWTTVVVCAVAIVGLSVLARSRSGAIAAALFATAAGVGFAFQASVTKVWVNDLDGLAGVLRTWTTYGLVVSALLGFALQQSALKTGFLAPAMAASNATTLVMTVVLGVTVFEESLSKGSGRLSPSVIGLAVAAAGVVILATPDRELAAT